ncbi:hypothetical protein SISSUDRAFT_1066315 [Sistotremastrum suecicum HHB10207 ss-3]|uniref:Uncharacterized protein n=1 Tax=Sistotremastrum suecicum HHB10207 ss-3 TaxID=1314776 RepID=A0A165YGA7_9AGAM|nr:hypothetical protein SISSUDRAFT_1066315 [Sistotremastrum suecicum HHB10207 ss-3]
MPEATSRDLERPVPPFRVVAIAYEGRKFRCSSRLLTYDVSSNTRIQTSTLIAQLVRITLSAYSPLHRYPATTRVSGPQLIYDSVHSLDLNISPSATWALARSPRGLWHVAHVGSGT